MKWGKNLLLAQRTLREIMKKKTFASILSYFSFFFFFFFFSLHCIKLSSHYNNVSPWPNFDILGVVDVQSFSAAPCYFTFEVDEHSRWKTQISAELLFLTLDVAQHFSISIHRNYWFFLENSTRKFHRSRRISILFALDVNLVSACQGRCQWFSSFAIKHEELLMQELTSKVAGHVRVPWWSLSPNRQLKPTPNPI